MKLLTSLLFAAAQAANLCNSGADPLITATCDHTGFTISVDEPCRQSHYSFIDWSSTFVDGLRTTVEWGTPAAPAAGCQADGTGAAWTYSVAFTTCNIAAAVLDSTADGDNVKWNTYTLYLNFDNTIATNGVGNLQQLGQTEIKCRIPANLQENAVMGVVALTDPDIVPDQINKVDLWTGLTLEVDQGGTDTAASYTGTALTAGATIALGEHVKLYLAGTTIANYNVAIKDCWASTISNDRTGSSVDESAAGAADGTVGGSNFDATGGTGAFETVRFYENRCPKYGWVKSWDSDGVTPADGSTIDKLEMIELRQFAFNDAVEDTDGGAATLSATTFFYHCEVDICLSGVDCVADPTCTAISHAPAGRRRRAILSSKRIRRGEDDSGVNSSTLHAGSTCPDGQTLVKEDNVYVCHVDVDGSPKANAQSAALSILTGALVCALH